MRDTRTLEIALETLEEELMAQLPKDPEIRRLYLKIAEISRDLNDIKMKMENDPFLKEAGFHYFGLDPLKISGLNLSYAIEADEHRFLFLYLKLSYNLILANLLRHRIVPKAKAELQIHFTQDELLHYAAAAEMMQGIEEELRLEAEELKEEEKEHRKNYESFLFVQSSHEAAKSFGAYRPDIKNHHPSWKAFSQLLTSLAVKIHESESQDFIIKCRKMNARREAIFENCAELFAQINAGEDGKKIYRQLSSHLSDIQKLETEIETTLSGLAVPGLHDYASFIMKKNRDEGTTFELNPISPKTGEKT